MDVKSAIQAVAQHLYELGATRVVLFGSQAKGNTHLASDIDIAYDFGGSPLDAGTWAQLLSWVDGLPCARKVDLVDMNYHLQPELGREIEEHGQLIGKA